MSGQDITSLTVTMAEFHLSPAGSPGAVVVIGCDNVLTSSGAVRINGSAFEVPVRGPQGSTIARGTFSSATTATGSVDKYTPTAPCPGTTLVGTLIEVDSDTWQAQRQ